MVGIYKTKLYICHSRLTILVVKIELQMNKLNVLISYLAPERTFKTKLYAFVSLLQCLKD